MNNDQLLILFMAGCLFMHFILLGFAVIRKQIKKYHGSFGYFILTLSSVFMLGFIIPLTIKTPDFWFITLSGIMVIFSIFYYHRHTQELEDEQKGIGENDKIKK